MNWTIYSAHQALKERKITSEELTRFYLKRIEKIDSKINAFITVCSEKALEQAKEADRRWAKGKPRSLLDGIPCAIKDNISTKDIRTTAASQMLDDYVPPFNATVVEGLRSAGAVILGKTNLDEFAMGSSTENSAYGPTRNPWDLERVPGGSSGGSAAAVAANLCVFALGSDTGGSIRQPASFCGVYGLKPTYGRVSRYGLLAMASSLDQIGPITKTVADAQAVMAVIEGNDPLDATSQQVPADSSLTTRIENLRIGVPKEFFEKGLEGEVRQVIQKMINRLKKRVKSIEEVSLPQFKYALAAYYVIMPVEVASDLARYDGIKYGFSVLKEKGKNWSSLLEVYRKSRAGFGPEARRRIMLGTYVSSAGYYEAYYKQAQKVRDLVKEDFARVFEKVDLLVGPVSPTVAFKIGEKTAEPLQMYLADIYTVPVNPAGLPAASVPAGFAHGLPVGLQIIGPRWSEKTIYLLSQIAEETAEIKGRFPQLEK